MLPLHLQPNRSTGPFYCVNCRLCGACCHDTECSPHSLDETGAVGTPYHDSDHLHRGGGANGNANGALATTMDADCYSPGACKGARCYSSGCRAKYAAQQPTLFRAPILAAAELEAGAAGEAATASAAPPPCWVQARVVAVASRFTDDAIARNVAKVNMADAAKKKAPAEKLDAASAGSGADGSDDRGHPVHAAAAVHRRSLGTRTRLLPQHRSRGRGGARGARGAGAGARSSGQDRQPVTFQDAPPVFAPTALPQVPQPAGAAGAEVSLPLPLPKMEAGPQSKAHKRNAKRRARIQRELIEGTRVLEVQVAIVSTLLPENFQRGFVRIGESPSISQHDHDDDGEGSAELSFWFRFNAAAHIRALGTASASASGSSSPQAPQAPAADWQWRLQHGSTVAVACQTQGYIRVNEPGQDGSASAKTVANTVDLLDSCNKRPVQQHTFHGESLHLGCARRLGGTAAAHSGVPGSLI